jgi:hypothetical protein
MIKQVAGALMVIVGIGMMLIVGIILMWSQTLIGQFFGSLNNSGAVVMAVIAAVLIFIGRKLWKSGDGTAAIG